MEEALVDVIKEGQIITMLASQARAEDLFILRQHADPARVAEAAAPSVPFSARTRDRENDPTHYRAIRKWHSYEPEYKKNNVIKDLIENFQWEVARGRKAKNLSRAQLAKAMNVPEHNIKLLENGELPSDDFVLVSKVESLLGIKLRRNAMPSVPATPGLVGASANAEVSLASLQRMRENLAKDKPKSQPVKSSFSGSDIELIE